MRGRPLRFLGTVTASWVGLRVVLLWPTAPGLPELIRALAPPLAAATESPAPLVPAMARFAAGRLRPIAPADPIAPQAQPLVTPALSAPPPAVAAAPILPDPVAPPHIPPPLAPTPPSPARLAGSAWAIARAGGGAVAPSGQLGGSQAGVRLTYALGPGRRLGVAARLSAPLQGRGAEAALGVEWRPLDLPVRLLAEHRFAVDGGRGGPAVLAVAGLPPTRVGPLTAEAYAQAGAVFRDRVARFADGAARLTRRTDAQGLRLDLGVGAWGGAQPGATRLDIGPTLGLGLPVAGRNLRLTADWRQRVAGGARPGSGPALSIGTDF